MVTTERAEPTWELFRDSGQPRPRASTRTDVITTVLSVWFTVGLFLDAYAHANLPGLETFFTPWHAVFYSGFAATAGWILWTVWRHVREGRRGLAAVPLGYGMTVLALPVFAICGGIDMLWHELLGIETSTDIFFSPSHLGLVGAMVVILTSPLRAAWADPPGPIRKARSLLPAVLTLALAASLVLLFLTDGNALLFGAEGVVEQLSDRDGPGDGRIAARIVITNIVLLAPLLLLARRWTIPAGAATIGYGIAALISALLSGFANLEIVLAVLGAGIVVDGLAALLRPGPDRRGAVALFAALAPLLTWAGYLGTAAVAAGRLPAVTEFWTGIPVVAGLLGWLLAAIMQAERQHL